MPKRGAIPFSASLSSVARVHGRLRLGEHSRIDDFCVLSGDIRVGRYVHIACGCSLIGDIELGDYSNLSGGVRIYAKSDCYTGEWMTNPTVPAVYTRVDERPVRLGKHAIVGANAVILPGVVIGEGAAIGAQAIITKDVEPWAIVVGRNQKVGVRSQRLLELEAQLCAS